MFSYASVPETRGIHLLVLFLPIAAETVGEVHGCRARIALRTHIEPLSAIAYACKGAAGLEDDLQKLYDELINPLYTEKIWNASQLDTSLKYFHIDYVALYTESINQNALPDSFTEIKAAEDFVLYHID